MNTPWLHTEHSLKTLTFSGVFLLFAFMCKKEEEKPVQSVDLYQVSEINSRLLNRSVTYAVLLPEEYNTGRDSFPVVYLLHGFGDNFTAWKLGGNIEYYAGAYATVTGPVIYVMPDGYNSYYVNRYNGKFPYMDMFVNELVPAVDSLFRTRKESIHRAVMGYSMGGYGAMILPLKHPEIFSTGVCLSMSFRTDEQYLAEPQSVFDYQFGAIFGGTGSSGTGRITEYFKEHSPFYLFRAEDLSPYSHLRFLIDCGDDEEQLNITNDDLHVLMRQQNLPHSYRVRNGAHSWDYWHASLPEAFGFIADGFHQQNTSTDQEIPYSLTYPAPTQFDSITTSGNTATVHIVKPPSYKETEKYPSIYIFSEDDRNEISGQSLDRFALLNDAMIKGKIPPALIVNIPHLSTDDLIGNIQLIIARTDSLFHTIASPGKRIALAFGNTGADMLSVIRSASGDFVGCFLYNANIPDSLNEPAAGVFYYLDQTDDNASYTGYNRMYKQLKYNNMPFEYRVRQSTTPFNAMQTGLYYSLHNMYLKLSN
jgi:S-formylglutathione hydrolase FrmB